MERRLLKVLKGLAEYFDVSLGDLLEGIVLHAFERKHPFGDDTVAVIERLGQVYGLDLTAADSHRLTSADDLGSAHDLGSADGEPTMTTCTRVRLTGSIDVALPPGKAFALFTPSGERGWAQGWEPEFPSQVTDDAEPGTVFQTSHAGRPTIWTVAGRDPGTSIQYTSVTPGQRAGLITVECQATPDGTRVTVSYDLTSLVPAANAELRRFADEYPRFLAHWEHAIANLVTSAAGPA